MAGGAAVWCWYDVRAGCCCPLLYSYVGRRGAISYRRGIIGPARGGGGVLPVQRPAAAGVASSARRGLSGAICPAGRGAAVLSYIAMYGAAGRDLLPARASSARRGAAAGAACPASSGGGVRSPTGAGIIEPPRESRPRKTPHGKGQQKRGRRGGGPCLPLFCVILPGRSFFRCIVRGGRLESIAGHSFPRGVHDIPRHAFPGVGGGGVQILFNFFRDSN